MLSAFLNGGGYGAFKIHVFIRANGMKDYQAKVDMIRNTVHSAFGQQAIPVNVIAQAPEYPVQVIIEAGFYPSSVAEIAYRSSDGHHYCHIRASGYNEFWFTGIHEATLASEVRKSADKAFSAMHSLINKAGLNMDNIVRQWNFIGGILKRRILKGEEVQHYQLFNEVRNVYYGKYRSSPGYPAATGVGMNVAGVIMDCCAIGGDEGVKTIAVSNPRQYDSYAYEQDVLVGSSQQEYGGVKHPPQFERARLIMAGGHSRLLISGTASIRGQENVAEGDVLQQTQVTIDNIRLLVSPENLRAHCPSLESIPDRYAYARIYVKNNEDIARIRALCTKHFGDAPLTFVQADICRDDLLVEIEAEMTD